MATEHTTSEGLRPDGGRGAHGSGRGSDRGALRMLGALLVVGLFLRWVNVLP